MSTYNRFTRFSYTIAFQRTGLRNALCSVFDTVKFIDFQMEGFALCKTRSCVCVLLPEIQRIKRSLMKEAFFSAVTSAIKGTNLSRQHSFPFLRPICSHLMTSHFLTATLQSSEYSCLIHSVNLY